jgi:hypothetical protein
MDQIKGEYSILVSKRVGDASSLYGMMRRGMRENGQRVAAHRVDLNQRVIHAAR